METNSLVSIIVPVYKVPDFINRCVESLVSQTYKNIEIILVDDGSPDDCPAICNRLAEKDDRIVVIHKENGGLSSARNAGIDRASGDYIAFVDGDDFVTADYVEVLLKACKENNVKLSVCGYYEYYSDDNMKAFVSDKSYVLTGDDAVRDIFTMKNDVHVVAWNKLYARELFKDGNIKYAEGKLHEDVFTTYKFCAATENVACVNKACYYYVQRAGSIINQSFHSKRLQLIEAVESIEPFVKKNSPKFDEEYFFYVFLNYLTVINAMADSNYKDKELFAKMAGLIFAMLPQLKQNRYFGKKNLLTVIFLKFGMNIFYIIRKIYKRIG